MTAERAMVGHSILGVGNEKSFISMSLSPSWANGSLQKDKRKKEQGIALTKISATALNYSLTTFGSRAENRGPEGGGSCHGAHLPFDAAEHRGMLLVGDESAWIGC